MTKSQNIPKKESKAPGKPGVARTDNLGKKSLSGGGQSPVLRARMPQACIDKYMDRGGRKWLQNLIEAA